MSKHGCEPERRMETTDNPLTQAGRKAWGLYRRDKEHEISQWEYANRLTSSLGPIAVCSLCRKRLALIIGAGVCLSCGRNCLVR